MFARKPQPSMRAPSKFRSIEARQDAGVPDKLSLPVDSKLSVRLPEFVAQFTLRAGQVFRARGVVLALAHGKRLETVLANDLSGRPLEPEWTVLNAALTELVFCSPLPRMKANAPSRLDRGLLQWTTSWVVQLAGSDGDVLGALCLVGCAKRPTSEQRKLIETLASHAAIALENSRLFSRIEHSKRQWVEDFDAISDLIVVHDPGNTILRVNRSLAQALSSTPSELVGKSARVLNAIACDMSGSICPFCPDGEEKKESMLHAGSRTLLVSTSRISAGAEEGSRTIHVLKDITEQRKYQTQLQRERDFNTKILNSTQSMILVLDTAGLVSYANRRCFDSGYNKETLLGCKFAEFIPVKNRSLFKSAFGSAVRGIASENLEMPLLRGNRNTGRFSVTFSPMRDERGRVNSIILVITDITEGAVLQAQLRHSEKMAALGQLVSGVAHEINNPLAAIVGYSDLLLENREIPESSRDDLQIISKEAERAKEIVQNLLRFARQMPPKRETLEIHAALQQALQLRAYGTLEDKVEIIERFDDTAPAVFGDAQQLQQVFLNVLNNAHDAIRESGREGKIEIVTRQRGKFVEIVIRDNGVGISDTTRIFEPFYTTKEVGKGTGLGLSICYGIVREHGGEISCRNNADGEGCEFLIQLPVAKLGEISLGSGAGATQWR